jgi:hypothetical protein
MSEQLDAVEALDIPEAQKRMFRSLIERIEADLPWDPAHPLGHDFPTDLVAGYLERHGQEWTAQPLPEFYDRGEAHECYRNATHLVMEDRSLRYCEGYVHRADSAFHFLHGWAVDADGNVIDPTLDDSEECSYWGVAYATDEYLAYIVRTGHFGVLGGDFGDGIAVLENDGLPSDDDLLPIEDEPIEETDNY